MRGGIDTAIIMAGGVGMRLRPYTTVLPKPLMPLGNRPIIEILIRQLSSVGIRHVVVSTGRFETLIRAVVDHADTPGVTVSYQTESAPLGTCGVLALIGDALPERFLVVNGDLLSDFPFGELVASHLNADAALTIATCLRRETVGFGVVERDAEGNVVAYLEKPSYARELSIGAYAFERQVVGDWLEAGSAMDVPDVVSRLLESGAEVRAVGRQCEWIDIGNPEELLRAQRLFDERPEAFGAVS